MEITLNKYTGTAYLNLLRQTLLCRIPVVRPVAFRVGSSNVVGLGDLAEEDTSEFISNVSSSSFVLPGDEEFYAWKGTVDSVLSFAAKPVLGSVTVLQTGVKDVLHVFAPVTVEIFFRKGCGKFTAQENEAFLEEHGVELDSTVAVNSRHCAVNLFTFKESGVVGDDVVFELNILSENGDTGQNLLKKALDIIARDVGELSGIGSV